MPSGITTTCNIAAPPAAPTLTSVSGGSIAAATYYVIITYTNNIGETLGSAQSTLAVAASHLFKVTSPSAYTNATHYNVYAGLSTGILLHAINLQVSNVAIGTDWTEPSSGLITGVVPPTALANVDLDSIFLAYNSPDTQAAATGITIGTPAVDLNQRYEKLSYGSASSATGIESGSADLNTFFAANTGGTWTATLPSFPNPFTTSPQPAVGTSSMLVTLANSPSGTLTYLWSYSFIPPGDGGSFNIVTGQGTNTITWYASAPRGVWVTIKVQCLVTAPNLTSVTGTTTMTFHYGTPS